MKLSVIIPVYNEKNTILSLLEKVRAVRVDKEIIIVDDGSTDGTRELLKQYQESSIKSQVDVDSGDCMRDMLKTYDVRRTTHDEIKVIFHEKNQGKGMAIRTGLKAVTGEAVIMQDADLEYDPNDYLKLIEPIIKGEAVVVYGSRITGSGRKSYWSFYLGGKFLSFLTNLLYGTRITDEPTCYKAFRADVIKGIDLKCRRFEFCPEVTAKISRRGHRILEIPISYEPRSMEEGKKISWKDGLEAIWTLIKYRFSE